MPERRFEQECITLSERTPASARYIVIPDDTEPESIIFAEQPAVSGDAAPDFAPDAALSRREDRRQNRRGGA